MAAAQRPSLTRVGATGEIAFLDFVVALDEPDFAVSANLAFDVLVLGLLHERGPIRLHLSLRRLSFRVVILGLGPLGWVVRGRIIGPRLVGDHKRARILEVVLVVVLPLALHGNSGRNRLIRWRVLVVVVMLVVMNIHMTLVDDMTRDVGTVECISGSQENAVLPISLTDCRWQLRRDLIDLHIVLVVISRVAQNSGHVLQYRGIVSFESVKHQEGSSKTHSRVGIARKVLLPVDRGGKARGAVQLRIDGVAGLLVKGAIDDTGDVRALSLGKDGVISREVADNSAQVGVAQLVDLKEAIGDLSLAVGSAVHVGQGMLEVN